MKIARLAKQLGVTRGSFYWHFKTVPIYQKALFEYWLKKLIRAATTEAKASDSPVSSLINSIAAQDLPKYDHAIRLWAQTNQIAARAVERADDFRLARVAEILRLQGVGEQEAQMRSQAIIWILRGTQNEANLRWRNKVFLELFTIATRQ